MAAWCSRMIRSWPATGAPYNIEIFVSGYVVKDKASNVLSRSQRTLLRLAKSWLPSLFCQQHELTAHPIRLRILAEATGGSRRLRGQPPKSVHREPVGWESTSSKARRDDPGIGAAGLAPSTTLSSIGHCFNPNPKQAFIAILDVFSL